MFIYEWRDDDSFSGLMHVFKQLFPIRCMLLYPHWNECVVIERGVAKVEFLNLLYAGYEPFYHLTFWLVSKSFEVVQEVPECLVLFKGLGRGFLV